MFHDVTYDELRLRRARRVRVAAGLALAVALATGATAQLRATERQQGAAVLRQAVLDAALRCCAVEGSYPSSLAHLERHYGLVVNERRYLVSYQWLGDNVVPSVVVRPL